MSDTIYKVLRLSGIVNEPATEQEVGVSPIPIGDPWILSQQDNNGNPLEAADHFTHHQHTIFYLPGTHSGTIKLSFEFLQAHEQSSIGGRIDMGTSALGIYPYNAAWVQYSIDDGNNTWTTIYDQENNFANLTLARYRELVHLANSGRFGLDQQGLSWNNAAETILPSIPNLEHLGLGRDTAPNTSTNAGINAYRAEWNVPPIGGPTQEPVLGNIWFKWSHQLTLAAGQTATFRILRVALNGNGGVALRYISLESQELVSPEPAILNSEADNEHVHHQIPRSDLNYSWVDASVKSSTNTLGQKVRHFTNSSGFETDNPFGEKIEFLSQSELGTHARLREQVGAVYTNDYQRLYGLNLLAEELDFLESIDPYSFIPVDFLGLNTIIREPVNQIGDNTLGFDFLAVEDTNNFLVFEHPDVLYQAVDANYINSEFISNSLLERTHPAGVRYYPEDTTVPSIPTILNSLILNRQGPYGWPVFKQISGANHPIVREQNKNNTFTTIYAVPVENEDGDSTLMSIGDKKLGYREPILSTSDPVKILEVKNAGYSILFKDSFINRNTYFAGNRLNVVMGTQGIKKSSIPYKGYTYIDYTQRIFPRSINVGTEETRVRPNSLNATWRYLESHRDHPVTFVKYGTGSLAKIYLSVLSSSGEVQSPLSGIETKYGYQYGGYKFAAPWLLDGFLTARRKIEIYEATPDGNISWVSSIPMYLDDHNIKNSTDSRLINSDKILDLDTVGNTPTQSPSTTEPEGDPLNITGALMGDRNNNFITRKYITTDSDFDSFSTNRDVSISDRDKFSKIAYSATIPIFKTMQDIIYGVDPQLHTKIGQSSERWNNGLGDPVQSTTAIAKRENDADGFGIWDTTIGGWLVRPPHGVLSNPNRITLQLIGFKNQNAAADAQPNNPAQNMEADEPRRIENVYDINGVLVAQIERSKEGLIRNIRKLYINEQGQRIYPDTGFLQNSDLSYYRNIPITKTQFNSSKNRIELTREDQRKYYFANILAGNSQKWTAHLDHPIGGPNYNTYEEYCLDVRPHGKDFSILPEFRIENFIKEIIESGESPKKTMRFKSSFLEVPSTISGFNSLSDDLIIDAEYFDASPIPVADLPNDSIREYPLGPSIGMSGPDIDHRVYTTTDLLKMFDMMEVENIDSTTRRVKLKARGVKKFLPYEGFYPAERTANLVTQFAESYYGNFELVTGEDGQSAYRPWMQALFAPGILFNTIKSCIAVDYPVFTNPYEVCPVSPYVINHRQIGLSPTDFEYEVGPIAFADNSSYSKSVLDKIRNDKKYWWHESHFKHPQSAQSGQNEMAMGGLGFNEYEGADEVHHLGDFNGANIGSPGPDDIGPTEFLGDSTFRASNHKTNTDGLPGISDMLDRWNNTFNHYTINDSPYKPEQGISFMDPVINRDGMLHGPSSPNPSVIHEGIRNRRSDSYDGFLRSHVGRTQANQEDLFNVYNSDWHRNSKNGVNRLTPSPGLSELHNVHPVHYGHTSFIAPSRYLRSESPFDRGGGNGITYPTLIEYKESTKISDRLATARTYGRNLTCGNMYSPYYYKKYHSEQHRIDQSVDDKLASSGYRHRADEDVEVVRLPLITSYSIEDGINYVETEYSGSFVSPIRYALGSRALDNSSTPAEFGYRIPFEAIVDPDLIRTGLRIHDSGAWHPETYNSVSSTMSSSKNANYRLAANNFFAETIDFFLKDGQLSKFSSKSDTDPSFGNVVLPRKGYQYRMRLYLLKDPRELQNINSLKVRDYFDAVSDIPVEYHTGPAYRNLESETPKATFRKFLFDYFDRWEYKKGTSYDNIKQFHNLTNIDIVGFAADLKTHNPSFVSPEQTSQDPATGEWSDRLEAHRYYSPTAPHRLAWEHTFRKYNLEYPDNIINDAGNTIPMDTPWWATNLFNDVKDINVQTAKFPINTIFKELSLDWFNVFGHTAQTRGPLQLSRISNVFSGAIEFSYNVQNVEFDHVYRHDSGPTRHGTMQGNTPEFDEDANITDRDFIRLSKEDNSITIKLGIGDTGTEEKYFKETNIPWFGEDGPTLEQYWLHYMNDRGFGEHLRYAYPSRKSYMREVGGTVTPNAFRNPNDEFITIKPGAVFTYRDHGRYFGHPATDALNGGPTGSSLTAKRDDYSGYGGTRHSANILPNLAGSLYTDYRVMTRENIGSVRHVYIETDESFHITNPQNLINLYSSFATDEDLILAQADTEDAQQAREAYGNIDFPNVITKALAMKQVRIARAHKYADGVIKRIPDGAPVPPTSAANDQYQYMPPANERHYHAAAGSGVITNSVASIHAGKERILQDIRVSPEILQDDIKYWHYDAHSTSTISNILDTNDIYACLYEYTPFNINLKHYFASAGSEVTTTGYSNEYSKQQTEFIIYNNKTAFGPPCVSVEGWNTIHFPQYMQNLPTNTRLNLQPEKPETYNHNGDRLISHENSWRSKAKEDAYLRLLKDSFNKWPFLRVGELISNEGPKPSFDENGNLVQSNGSANVLQKSVALHNLQLGLQTHSGRQLAQTAFTLRDRSLIYTWYRSARNIGIRPYHLPGDLRRRSTAGPDDMLLGLNPPYYSSFALSKYGLPFVVDHTQAVWYAEDQRVNPSEINDSIITEISGRNHVHAQEGVADSGILPDGSWDRNAIIGSFTQTDLVINPAPPQPAEFEGMLSEEFWSSYATSTLSFLDGMLLDQNFGSLYEVSNYRALGSNDFVLIENLDYSTVSSLPVPDQPSIDASNIGQISLPHTLTSTFSDVRTGERWSRWDQHTINPYTLSTGRYASVGPANRDNSDFPRLPILTNFIYHGIREKFPDYAFLGSSQGLFKSKSFLPSNVAKSRYSYTQYFSIQDFSNTNLPQIPRRGNYYNALGVPDAFGNQALPGQLGAWYDVKEFLFEPQFDTSSANGITTIEYDYRRRTPGNTYYGTSTLHHDIRLPDLNSQPSSYERLYPNEAHRPTEIGGAALDTWALKFSGARSVGDHLIQRTKPYSPKTVAETLAHNNTLFDDHHYLGFTEPLVSYDFRPYTPPYYEGYSYVEYVFTPQRSGKYTLDEIFANTNVINYRKRDLVKYANTLEVEHYVPNFWHSNFPVATTALPGLTSQPGPLDPDSYGDPTAVVARIDVDESARLRSYKYFINPNVLKQKNVGHPHPDKLKILQQITQIDKFLPTGVGNFYWHTHPKTGINADQTLRFFQSRNPSGNLLTDPTFMDIKRDYTSATEVEMMTYWPNNLKMSGNSYVIPFSDIRNSNSVVSPALEGYDHETGNFVAGDSLDIGGEFTLIFQEAEIQAHNIIEDSISSNIDLRDLPESPGHFGTSKNHLFSRMEDKEDVHMSRNPGADDPKRFIVDEPTFDAARLMEVNRKTTSPVRVSEVFKVGSIVTFFGIGKRDFIFPLDSGTSSTQFNPTAPPITDFEPDSVTVTEDGVTRKYLSLSPRPGEPTNNQITVEPISFIMKVKSVDPLGNSVVFELFNTNILIGNNSFGKWFGDYANSLGLDIISGFSFGDTTDADSFVHGHPPNQDQLWLYGRPVPKRRLAQLGWMVISDPVPKKEFGPYAYVPRHCGADYPNGDGFLVNESTWNRLNPMLAKAPLFIDNSKRSKNARSITDIFTETVHGGSWSGLFDVESIEDNFKTYFTPTDSRNPVQWRPDQKQPALPASTTGVYGFNSVRGEDVTGPNPDAGLQEKDSDLQGMLYSIESFINWRAQPLLTESIDPFYKEVWIPTHTFNPTTMLAQDEYHIGPRSYGNPLGRDTGGGETDLVMGRLDPVDPSAFIAAQGEIQASDIDDNALGDDIFKRIPNAAFGIGVPNDRALVVSRSDGLLAGNRPRYNPDNAHSAWDELPVNVSQGPLNDFRLRNPEWLNAFNMLFWWRAPTYYFAEPAKRPDDTPLGQPEAPPTDGKVWSTQENDGAGGFRDIRTEEGSASESVPPPDPDPIDQNVFYFRPGPLINTGPTFGRPIERVNLSDNFHITGFRDNGAANTLADPRFEQWNFSRVAYSLDYKNEDDFNHTFESREYDEFRRFGPYSGAEGQRGQYGDGQDFLERGFHERVKGAKSNQDFRSIDFMKEPRDCGAHKVMSPTSQGDTSFVFYRYQNRLDPKSSLNYRSEMTMESSFNLFGATNVRNLEFDDFGKVKTVREDTSLGSKWVISPKFETPVLDFSKWAARRDRQIVEISMPKFRPHLPLETAPHPDSTVDKPLAPTRIFDFTPSESLEGELQMALDNPEVEEFYYTDFAAAFGLMEAKFNLHGPAVGIDHLQAVAPPQNQRGDDQPGDAAAVADVADPAQFAKVGPAAAGTAYYWLRKFKGDEEPNRFGGGHGGFANTNDSIDFQSIDQISSIFLDDLLESLKSQILSSNNGLIEQGGSNWLEFDEEYPNIESLFYRDGDKLVIVGPKAKDNNYNSVKFKVVNVKLPFIYETVENKNVDRVAFMDVSIKQEAGEYVYKDRIEPENYKRKDIDIIPDPIIGMWHQEGEIPTEGTGLSMLLTDVRGDFSDRAPAEAVVTVTNNYLIAGEGVRLTSPSGEIELYVEVGIEAGVLTDIDPSADFTNGSESFNFSENSQTNTRVIYGNIMPAIPGLDPDSDIIGSLMTETYIAEGLARIINLNSRHFTAEAFSGDVFIRTKSTSTEANSATVSTESSRRILTSAAAAFSLDGSSLEVTQNFSGAGTAVYQYGSLLDLVGFERMNLKPLGEIAEFKRVKEAVLAIPLQRGSLRSNRFVPVSRTHVRNVLLGRDLESVPESLIKMVNTLKDYVLPPNLDFINDPSIDPFLIYVLEFEHDFTKQDLADIWQNLYPRDSAKVEVISSEFEHDLADFPNFELDETTRWSVFKVKQKAKKNYFNKVNQSLDNVIEKMKNSDLESLSMTQAEPTYSYNWPYDYFSLIELFKMDTEITMTNGDIPTFEEYVALTKKLGTDAAKTPQELVDMVESASEARADALERERAREAEAERAAARQREERRRQMARRRPRTIRSTVYRYSAEGAPYIISSDRTRITLRVDSEGAYHYYARVNAEGIEVPTAEGSPYTYKVGVIPITSEG